MKDAVSEYQKLDQYVALVLENGSLFHDSKHIGYLIFEVNGHREVYALDCDIGRRAITGLLYRQTGKAISKSGLESLTNQLSAIAIHDSECIEVSQRVAFFEGKYYIDIGDDTWAVYQVDEDGWRKLKRSPVPFIRSLTMRALPKAKKNGKIKRLFRYVNVAKHARILIVTFMLEVFRPQTDNPALALSGGQGVAKTSSAKAIRMFTDPNAVSSRAIPKTREDLFVSASANRLLSIDNVSHLSARMQDAMCILATGGGYGGRTLYTNSEETVIDVSRPLMISSINHVVTAQDLIDRTIPVECPELKKRQAGSALAKALADDAPGIMGAILTIFSKALRILPELEGMRTVHRLADFALLGEAVAQVMGSKRSFSDIYAENRNSAVLIGLESSPAIQELIAYLGETYGYTGTINGIFEALRQRVRYFDNWPKSPRGFAELLRRHSTALRSIGVTVEFDGTRHNDGRHVTISFDTKS